ncbi:hypothetical protein C1I98_12240 [Spongiactinospora gelatinilytica]|uniref:Uncharacterized protein n=1 Tax=Spongiactinospora gelatinilytica TaxID=2666298 RepID=A0A2W2HSE9_9ACTN|nr:hypothetical protein [Spongiactinospora gelatinilytica]PZG48867.1 hypothetical protein C1I98_12240 [Spongiactinospora gelatinilytica]
MNKVQKLAALAVLPVAAALVAVPAQAAGQAAERPSCPAPSKAEMLRSSAAKVDRPARGAAAIKGVRVDHIPKGFTHGQVIVNKHDGMVEYGYQWSDDRDDVSRRHRALWVRVVCWPKATSLAQLKNAPFSIGSFSGDATTTKIGDRQVLRQKGDGALGAGVYTGWVERAGVVVTVMASPPLVPGSAEIIKGIRL